VIVGFADRATEDIFHGAETKAARTLPKTLWSIARRKLDMLNGAQSVQDLTVPPANRLEKLRGDLAGRYSIRINDQYRIVFQFEGGQASDVLITDYQ
jgi:proteic killer suppression protein